MKKDTTKKFLGKENRFCKRFTSIDVIRFVQRQNKKGLGIKQKNNDLKISYDLIEFRNCFALEKLPINTISNRNILLPSDKIKFSISSNSQKREFNMVYCDAGEFTMGVDAKNYEYPESSRYTNKVVIDEPFWISETKITRDVWDIVMQKNRYTTKVTKANSKHPITNITWYDAILFCNTLSKLHNKKPFYIFDWDVRKRRDYMENGFMDDDGNIVELPQISDIFIDKNANGYRLPTEIEWEYAALANCDYLYAGSDNPDEVACYDLDEMINVATKKPNAWGLYDMSGLAYEFCHDEWIEDVYKKRKDSIVNNKIVEHELAIDGDFTDQRVLRSSPLSSSKNSVGVLEWARIRVRAFDHAQAKGEEISFRIVCPFENTLAF